MIMANSLLPSELTPYSGSTSAILIMKKFAVIPAVMPESSAMDGGLEISQVPDLALL
jgi:hypothetical protein